MPQRVAQLGGQPKPERSVWSSVREQEHHGGAPLEAPGNMLYLAPPLSRLEQVIELERELEHLQAELRRRERTIALLRDVALASRGAADPRTVFDAIYTQLAGVLEFDSFFVALCEHEGAEQYRINFLVDEGQRAELPDLRVGGLTGYLLKHKQPMLFGDLQAEWQPRGLPQPLSYGNAQRRSSSWIGVPLLVGREAVGAMSISSYQKGVFDDDDLQLLSALGDFAAIAIENAMLYQAQDELSRSLAARVAARSEELAVLTSIAISSSQGRPLNELLDEVLERVLWLLGMDAGAIWLPERRGSLHRAAMRSEAQDPTAVPGRPEVLPGEWSSSEGTSPEAVAFRSGFPVQREEDEQLTLAVPLRSHGQTAGVMTLSGVPRDLTQHERSLLEAAGYQIAVGIENARLLRDRERQIARLEALNSIAAVTSATLDLRPMLGKVAEVLRTLLPVDGLLAGAYDHARGVLSSGISFDGDERSLIDRRELSANGRLAYVLRERRPVLLRHTDPLHQSIAPRRPWEAAALSWMGVPLEARDGRPIGVLAVQSRRPDAYDERDLGFLEAVGHQLALDVENAQLYAAARDSAAVAEHRADNLQLLHRIARLVNSSLDPQVVLGIAVEQLTRVFGVDHCAIAVYDRPGWSGQVVAEYPPIGARGRRIAFENVDDFADDLQDFGQPIWITDPLHDPRMRPARDLLRKFAIRSMLVAPLMSRGKAIGAISLNNLSAERVFTIEDGDLVRTIAAQVAGALENARLFQLSVTRVEQEMEIAHRMQAHLFPRELPEIANARLAARCVPARETGGDFYDVLSLGDGRFGIMVGDVSGKSLPAAMTMAVARSTVRSEAFNHALPEEVVDESNQLLIHDVLPDTFVALCYAVYHAGARILDLALAGQLTPLLRRRDGSVDFVPAGGSYPLGIVQDASYSAARVRLEPGDSVLLYTDGLVEAFSPERELWGFDRLRQTFAELGGRAAPEVVGALYAAVEAWQDGAERHDDITAVVLQAA